MEEEEEEEESEEGRVGTKRALKAKGWRQHKVVLHPRVSVRQRLEEFPGQTPIETKGELMFQACRKRLSKDKKTTVANHCKRVPHVQAMEAFKKKETSKQVCDSVVFRSWFRSYTCIYNRTRTIQQYSSIAFDVLKDYKSQFQISNFKPKRSSHFLPLP